MKRMKSYMIAAVLALFTSASAAEQSMVARLPYANTTAVLKFVKKHLPRDPVIIDAGAFNGHDSYLMAQFWPRGQIYSFEPVPELFQQVKYLSAKHKNIHPFELALSDKNGSAVFYLSVNDDNPNHISASSSLLPPKEHLAGAPTVKFPYTLEVQTLTLDSWAESQGIDHVDFLWLDMQGYELNMIKASKLAKNARAIWLEVEFIEAYEGQYLFEDIVEWMAANGFHLAATNFNLENPENWFADAMFIKTK
ncbi:MAG: FkbM family methyltransferase [Verrucomicrobia bacterium]|nr:FkbM family methyltransferase [Verrucomicrobiota bacterium]